MLRLPRVRTLRTTSALLRSLVLGTAFTAGGAVVCASLVSCADESQPEYWVEKLEDPQWRPKSIERLSQFFEGAVSSSKKDMEAPAVKELLNKIVEPLANTYVNQYDSLDEKTRETLVNLLSAVRDPRAEPALAKAFEEFGKKGRGGKELKWASRAVRDMKAKSLAPQVFAAFKKMKPSTKDGAYYRDFNEALLAVADPSWSSELISMVEGEIPFFKQGDKPTPDDISEKRDKTYQVITAAQVLGELKDGAAARPLLKVVLDPTRSDAGNEAILALTKIGKPSVDATLKLLKGQDKELATYHAKQIQKATGAKKPPEGPIYQDRAAMVLGALGRSEAAAPLIELIDSKEEDAEKVPLLNALAMLPHTSAVKKAFFDGLEGLANDAAVNGQNAAAALAEASTLFFDSSITPILVSKGRKLGKEDTVAKALLSLAAIKSMDQSQVRLVKGLVKRLPSPKDGPLVKLIAKINDGLTNGDKLLGTCKTDKACYLSEARKTANQGDKTELVGVKALYMVGQLGKAGDGAELIEAMPDFEKGSLRYVAAQIIDHHNIEGNEELAKKLEEIVEKNKKSMDKGKAAADKPLRDAMYRLQARGQ